MIKHGFLRDKSMSLIDDNAESIASCNKNDVTEGHKKFCYKLPSF